mgnify:CR=1 FL=1
MREGNDPIIDPMPKYTLLTKPLIDPIAKYTLWQHIGSPLYHDELLIMLYIIISFMELLDIYTRTD